MAAYLIVLNVFLVALVIAAVCGSLLWAIATQHHHWPRPWHPADRHLDTERVGTVPSPSKFSWNPSTSRLSLC